MMREIAGTVFGRNALMAGLICHAAALVVVSMMDVGGLFFFRIVYPISCLLLAAGAVVESKAAGYAPLKAWEWYAASAATILPVVGPLIALSCIYAARFGRNLSGLIPAIFGMQASLPMMFILILLLFLLFSLLVTQRDPYFKRRVPQAMSFHTVFVPAQKPYGKEVSCLR